MDTRHVVGALSALAQPTRLDVFRLIVSAEPDGMAAGDIARRLGVPHNTLSTHLAILSTAGLVSPERRSRNIIYRPDLGQLRKIILYLLKDCCGGKPEICAALIADLAPRCCEPSGVPHG